MTLSMDRIRGMSALPPRPTRPSSSSSRSRFSIRTLLAAHPAHVVTYLVCVALFSISFLVFVNATVSFVITDRLNGGSKNRDGPDDGNDGVGNAVGTLGFADELVTLVACPVWGMVSDRIGVRPVVVAAYALVALGLAVMVLAENVFPDLLLARMVFSVGAAAMTTMITALLPTITYHAARSVVPDCPVLRARQEPVTLDRAGLVEVADVDDYDDIDDDGHDHDQAELLLLNLRREPTVRAQSVALSFRMAGIIGTFAGFGALLALFAFLPLPALFQSIGWSASDSVASSYHIVATVALTLSVICFFGLRNLPGEENKRLADLVNPTGRESKITTDSRSRRDAPGRPDQTQTTDPSTPSYRRLLTESVLLGFRNSDIGLGYLSSFVARASSVAISLFIPLLVNMYFRSSGRCDRDQHVGLLDMKSSCPRAYGVAAALTGTSQLVALLTAPLFGYFSSRHTLVESRNRAGINRFNIPLLIAAISGLAGFALMATVTHPDPFGGKDNHSNRVAGHPSVLAIVSLLGLAQIGTTVCGLGLLAKGIQRHAETSGRSTSSTCPVSQSPGSSVTVSAHKGTIGSIASLSGAVGILAITKFGGLAFDKLGRGVPFLATAMAFAVLLVALVVSAARGGRRDRPVRI